MMSRKWMYLAAIVFLVSSSASAQKILAGDDGLTTPGGGRTTLDLAGFPIEAIFGAELQENSVVSLKGKSLGSGALEGIDTIIRRSKNIDIQSGSGTGPLEIVALSLVGESSVSIGGKPYALHVYLSEFRGDVQPGKVTLRMVNDYGGTFNSSLNVRTKLVFTDASGDSVTIDCGAVPCGDGEDLTLSATGASFTISGVEGGFDPATRGLKGLPAGLSVDGDGDGVAEVTTLASTNFFIGIIPSSPDFRQVPVDKQEDHSGFHIVITN